MGSKRAVVWARVVADELVLAGELGFEPRLTESESAVLPLNYSPKILCLQLVASKILSLF
jgi:hypothetical protein